MRHYKTKREVRLAREKRRRGGPNQGHGWAAKQAGRHEGASTSVRKRFKR